MNQILYKNVTNLKFNKARGKCDYVDLQQLTECEHAHWLLRC